MICGALVSMIGVVLACDGSLVPQSSFLGGGEGLGFTQRWQIDHCSLWYMNCYSR
jgi:hypothetical protein